MLCCRGLDDAFLILENNLAKLPSQLLIYPWHETDICRLNTKMQEDVCRHLCKKTSVDFIERCKKMSAYIFVGSIGVPAVTFSNNIIIYGKVIFNNILKSQACYLETPTILLIIHTLSQYLVFLKAKDLPFPQCASKL